VYNTLAGSYYWQDAAKRRTAGIKFTHRPKFRLFAPQGRLVAPIHVKIWQGRWASGSTWLCKISPQLAQGVGIRPQNIKNFHCLVVVLQGRTPWPIS